MYHSVCATHIRQLSHDDHAISNATRRNAEAHTQLLADTGSLLYDGELEDALVGASVGIDAFSQNSTAAQPVGAGRHHRNK